MKINFIDVGCAGYIPNPWDKNGYGKHIDSILVFDPLLEELNYLNNEFFKYSIYRYAAFDRIEKRSFYVCKRRRVSSLFPPNKKLLIPYVEDLNVLRKPKTYHVSKYDIEEIRQVECIRLQDAIDDFSIDFDFLKTDTEGGDFQVIKSLGKYIDTQIIGIHTELYFKELYKGITLFDEVDEFLKEHNFYMAKKLNGVKDYWSNFLYLRDCDEKREQINLIKDAYGAI